MRYLLLAGVLVLAACTDATGPSPDLARQKYPPGIIPCTVENGCIPVDLQSAQVNCDSLALGPISWGQWKQCYGDWRKE